MAKGTTKAKREKWESGDTDALVKAFLSMRDSREMKAFMRDLLTETEISEFAKRFRAARSIANRKRPRSPADFSNVAETEG